MWQTVPIFFFFTAGAFSWASQQRIPLINPNFTAFPAPDSRQMRLATTQSQMFYRHKWARTGAGSKSRGQYWAWVRFGRLAHKRMLTRYRICKCLLAKYQHCLLLLLIKAEKQKYLANSTYFVSGLLKGWLLELMFAISLLIVYLENDTMEHGKKEQTLTTLLQRQSWQTSITGIRCAVGTRLADAESWAALFNSTMQRKEIISPRKMNKRLTDCVFFSFSF